MTVSPEPCALVVDDSALALRIACEIVGEAGFRLHRARSGGEAIGLLAAHGGEIALLFTDVEMPGETDGFALARHAAERWPEMAIVVASGRVSPEEGDLPAHAAFLSKPYGADQVLRHLRARLPEVRQPASLKAG